MLSNGFVDPDRNAPQRSTNQRCAANYQSQLSGFALLREASDAMRLTSSAP